MRKDKAKNISKVAKEVIKNPLMTDREIEEKTGVSKSSVNRALHEMGQVGAKDKNIIDICAKDIEIIRLGQNILYERLTDPEELAKINARDVSGIIKENTARYTIFKGDVTDKEGGLKNSMSDMSTEELLKYASGE